jgi:hypothetical protein
LPVSPALWPLSRHNPYLAVYACTEHRASCNVPLQSNEPHRIVPISGLNPYLARWTIKARVTQKGDVRRWAQLHEPLAFAHTSV